MIKSSTHLNSQDTCVHAKETVNTLEFMGVFFDNRSTDEIKRLVRNVTEQDRFRYLVTPNVDHIIRLTKEPQLFKPLYKTAWLTICDSRIVELLARFSGIKLDVLPGSDLTKFLFDEVISPRDTVNVIGSTTEIVEQIKSNYELTNLNLHIPPMGLRNKPSAIAEAAKFVAKNPAKFTFICVGSPQQEMIARACLERTDCVGLGLCVGASLEFLSGDKKRAPEFLQTARLEWLFRLVCEPKRLWRRYILEGPKIFKIWLEWRTIHHNI